MQGTPREQGYIQPAEWHPHESVWLAWPAHLNLWGPQLDAVRHAFVQLCAAIADVDASGHPQGERIEVLCATAEAEAQAGLALRHLGARTHRFPYGDIWLRDTAPIFLNGPGGRRAAACFRFDGWGGKYRLGSDDTLAAFVAERTRLPTFQLPFVLEGGSVEPDGDGTLLTTRQCNLNPNRGNHGDEAQMSAQLTAALGAEKVLWLDEGLINDHTDGHIDTLVRFVAPGVVMAMEPSGPSDPNAEALHAILHALAGFTDARGRRLDVHTVPSPGAVLSDEGELLAASYVNVYIANRSVVVPVYGTPHDDEAVERIAALFPGRTTIPVPARALLHGGGAFHCISQQLPEPTDA